MKNLKEAYSAIEKLRHQVDGCFSRTLSGIRKENVQFAQRELQHISALVREVESELAELRQVQP